MTAVKSVYASVSIVIMYCLVISGGITIALVDISKYTVIIILNAQGVAFYKGWGRRYFET